MIADLTARPKTDRVKTNTFSIASARAHNLPTIFWLLALGGLFVASSLNADERLALPSAIQGQAGPLKGKPVRYFSRDAATLGYLAEPVSQSVKGGLILIHEWDGLTQRIKETADDFASAGFLVLATDLYRGQTGSNRSENLKLMRAARSNSSDIIENLNAAVAHLRQTLGPDGPVATIGWCFGGGIALSFALGGDHHDGTAIFYGQLIEDPDRLAMLDHEVYGTFAGLDRGPTVDQVDAFVSGLRIAGVPNDIHIYDEVNHGFWLHVDRDPQTHTAAARHAWHRLIRYLDRVFDAP